ncbi:hypothetical protein CAC42_6036 [Sphaceloma murrayae]|uniref:Uncharacterized protein n=1 Tax=Sphaceloma murrayae TaxID=2082308 RepID=A0A2K1QV64_9PEZI|nr:hypothetical protein CAC42_6036 [Sphaceloma murrayae]
MASSATDAISTAMEKLSLDLQQSSSRPAGPNSLSKEVLAILTEGLHALSVFMGEESCRDCYYCDSGKNTRPLGVVVPEMLRQCHAYFTRDGGDCPFLFDCPDCDREGRLSETRELTGGDEGEMTVGMSDGEEGLDDNGNGCSSDEGSMVCGSGDANELEHEDMEL